MKIAVCDDNMADLLTVVSLLNDYILLHEKKHIIEYTTFYSAADLIAALEKGQQYDLVLLDILMPFMTGMEASKEIRQFNQDIRIIFMTSSPEFAVESYSVNAYYYVLKPILKETLYILLDKVISELELQKDTSILAKGKNGLSRIYINRLEFAEVIGRTIFYHMSDGRIIEAIGSMSDLEKALLPNHSFIKPHRSYIINLEYIDTLSQREIKMHSHALIPMARANSRVLKSAYIAYSFNNIKVHSHI